MVGRLYISIIDHLTENSKLPSKSVGSRSLSTFLFFTQILSYKLAFPCLLFSSLCLSLSQFSYLILIFISLSSSF